MLLQNTDSFSYDYRIKFEALSNGNVKVTINRDEFDFGDDFEKVIKYGQATKCSGKI